MSNIDAKLLTPQVPKRLLDGRNCQSRDPLSPKGANVIERVENKAADLTEREQHPEQHGGGGRCCDNCAFIHSRLRPLTTRKKRPPAMNDNARCAVGGTQDFDCSCSIDAATA